MSFSMIVDVAPGHWKESDTDLFIVGSLPASGSLLEGVLGAQREAESIVGDYETLRGAAGRVVEHVRELGSPLVWPVGEAADRLVGAASLVAKGALRQRGWTDDLHGQRVVVLAVADVTATALHQAALHARQLGAVEVYGCRVGFTDVRCVADGGFDDFTALTVAAPDEIVIRRV